MKISDFRKAMRPKKYLTRDFVVYQDPKMLAARSEMQAGGVVEREELFQGGPLDPEIKKQIKAYLKENNVKPDFKSYKFGVPKKHPLYNNARYFQRGESQRAYKRERGKDPKFKKQKAQYQKKYYSTNREEVLQKAKEYYANPDVAERVRQRQNNYYLTAKGKERAKQALTKRIGEIGFFPPGGNYRENVWYDLYRSTIAKDGGRFVLDEKSMPKKIPMTKDGAINWAKDGLYKKVKFIDKQTNKKISLNTIDKYLDSTFGKGTYDKAINSYKEKDALKDIKIKYKGKEQRIGTITRNLYPGNVLSAFEVHHPEGVGKNWWSSQLTFRDANQQVRAIEGDLIRGSKLAKTKEAKQAFIKKQVKKLVNLPGGINFIFEGEILGKAPTKESILKASAEKFKDPSYTRQINKLVLQGINEASPQDLTDFISTLAPGCKLKYADGGRVNYSTGSDCFKRGEEIIKQARQQALQGDKTTAQKVGQSLKQFGKATGKLARFVELPLEIALESVLIGWDSTFNAKPLNESIKDNSIVLRAFFSDFQTSGEQDRAANIAKQNPQAAKYVEAKEALDKYNKLKNTINTFKDDLASADNYQNAVVKFEEYENEIRDKIPQYTAMLTPGSPEYEAFKEARIGLARDRVEKTYGTAQDMEELMQPFEGATDVADIQKAKAEELQGNIEDISSTYNFGPTFEEVTKKTIPELYKRTGREKNPQNDAVFKQLLKSQYDKNLNLFSRPEFSKGGLTRRGFLKVIGALTTLAAIAKTGIMKLTTPAAKKVLKDAPQGTPDWFAPLVEKIMKEGIDISDKAATIERQVVKELETPDGTYTVTEIPDTGEIMVRVDTGAGVNDFPVDFTMTPNRITGVADDGTPITEFGEFNIVETRAEGRLVSPDGDYDIEPGEYITNDLDDAASDWHSVEKFATGKTDEIAQKKKQDGKEFIEKNPGEDIVNRYGDYDPPEPEPDYD